MTLCCGELLEAQLGVGEGEEEVGQEEERFLIKKATVLRCI